MPTTDNDQPVMITGATGYVAGWIVSAHNTTFPALAKVLVERFASAYPIPRRTLPKWLVWLVGRWSTST